MSDPLETNNNSFLSNAKVRIILVLVAVAVVCVGAFLWFHFHQTSTRFKSSVGSAPSIQSLPGSNRSSDAYVQDQNKQNQQIVNQALKDNTSAVPTITRSGFKGSAQAFTHDAGSSQCSTILGVKRDPQNCTIDRLKASRQSGVSVSELRCQGCACPALRLAGYTAGSLKQAGFNASALKSCGYTVSDLIAAGFSAKKLQNSGLSADDLKAAGVAVASDGTQNCDVDELKKWRAKGISATELKQKGCSLAALMAAGFTPSELKAAGFSAGALATNAVSTNDLLDAGFAAKDLRRGGISAQALKKAGAVAADLKKAGYTDGDLTRAGFVNHQQNTSSANPCSQKNLQASLKAGASAADLQAKGCSRSALLAAGFPQNSLASSGDLNDLSADNASVPAIDNSQNVAKRIAAMQRQQEARMTAQQREERARQMVAKMQAQASKLIAGWSSVNKQSYNVVQDTAALSAHGGEGAASKKAQGPVITAGTVMFAVLQTGVNTDENSPILAKIVSGPLKGARLVGQFSRLNKKVLLSFKSFSMSDYEKSIPFSAVAIDSNTAHTAVSGNVNSHYLLRYGSLFASAFISGYADALVAGGTTVSGLGGFFLQTNNDLTPQQQLMVGVGNVGKQYSSKMSGNINRPPTVKIPSGTGIGVLLTSDLQLPMALTSKYNAFKKMEKLNNEQS